MKRPLRRRRPPYTGLRRALPQDRPHEAEGEALEAKGFRVTPHGRCGMKAETTVLTGFTGVVDGLLRQGVANSEAIYERIASQGYPGGRTTVKNYIRDHAALAPAKRKVVEPQGGRGKRYSTEPGEACQMGRGFADAVDRTGAASRLACFAMACHRCGTPYIESFPNARQENLFIGMPRAFRGMGAPDRVLADNMKNVVARRDAGGGPVWQADYASFMSAIGFRTTPCKPRHPFTKGKVERLVRFVKGDFLAGRSNVAGQS